MGTSQSHPGPGGNSPLVPSWADDQPQQPLPLPQPARFKPFRQALGSFVSSGSSGDLRRALGHYARKATGGSQNASRRMGSVTRAGGNLYGLLRGNGAYTSAGEVPISLEQLTGQPYELAVSAITQALSTDGGDTDKIQVAMQHALVAALDGVDTFDPSCITDDVIIDTMIGYLSESVFLQIVTDSGKAWNKAGTATQALQAESDLREVVRVLVDKYMAPRLNGKARSFTRSEIIQLEREVITEVWREWETYQ